MIPVIIRTENVESRSINAYLPVRGTAILVDQGKNLRAKTIAIASDEFISDDCESLSIYGEEYSGGVIINKTTLATAGTPFYTTTFTCLHEEEKA